MPVAVAACRAGLLEPIDAATLPPGDDGVAAARDFYHGMIGRCFVASAVYSQTMLCRKPCPGGLSALFDRARPVSPAAAGKPEAGDPPALANRKIGLQRTAKVNLEMALLADGVNPGQVYALLGTDAGVARAFAKLDTIKPNIVWWSSAGEPTELLRRKQVAATTILTAQAQAILQDGNLSPQDAALSRISPQFYEADVLAVPKGGARKDRALDYLRFATSSAPLANMVKFAPYTPPRRSALALVEGLPASPLRDFVMSQKNAMESAFAVDDAFWAEHGAALEARFRAWADAP
jgi:putative spermidine/putrescine transport system substrate-binding protein